MTSARSSDLARRVGTRRHQLGLTREEVAQRAGMAPSYLDYLERSTAPGNPQLVRLAGALETTVEHLVGGDLDRPVGPGRAGPHPRLEVLSEEECARLLAGGGIGHFVFVAPQGPIALPVNFRVRGRDLVFNTRAEGVLAAAAGSVVSIEVEHIDEAMSEGWSVLVTGRARLVDDPVELEEVARLGTEPWPGGRRDAVIVVEAETVSGRRIRQTAQGRADHDA